MMMFFPLMETSMQMMVAPPKEIYVMDSDGDNQIQLRDNYFFYGDFVWSRDSEKIIED
jgi:hypothetical protein